MAPAIPRKPAPPLPPGAAELSRWAKNFMSDEMPVLFSPGPGNHPMAPNRIYNTLVMLAHMMEINQPNARWRHRLRDHVQAQSFPVASHMGFPSDWLTRPMWQP